MLRACYRVVFIFLFVSLNLAVYNVCGKCTADCNNKCDATIDEKYKWGEEYIKGVKGSTDYLKMKNQEKAKCYDACDDACLEKAIKDTDPTDTTVKEKPAE